MRIFFITRTYPDTSSGGAIIRKGTVDNLRKLGYDIWIVAPNYLTNKVLFSQDKKEILIPFRGYSTLLNISQHIGIMEDYMSIWAKDSYNYLKGIITHKDLLFVTSGGELGPLILATLLKKSTSCKLLLNLHDPIGYTTLQNGEFTHKGKFFHVKRDRIEEYYFLSCDNIITSSKYYKEQLLLKYPHLKNKLSYNHFGYIEDLPLSKRNLLPDKKIVIAYGGAMGPFQSPEILAKACKDIKNVEVVYIGNYSYNKELLKYVDADNVKFISHMSHESYINFLLDSVDIGFLSLKGNISNLCVPSKLYEYINLGIPILGAVSGDSKTIINNNKFGLASDYDVSLLVENIKSMLNIKFYNKCKLNIVENKSEWSMSNKIQDVIDIINSIV